MFPVLPGLATERSGFASAGDLTANIWAAFLIFPFPHPYGAVNVWTFAGIPTPPGHRCDLPLLKSIRSLG